MNIHGKDRMAVWNRTQKGYFTWLAESVCLDKDPYFGQSYWELACILHGVTFHSAHPMDQNREGDARRLRGIWVDLMTSETEEMGYDLDICPESLEGPCSVLEVLIALATRLEDDIMQNEKYGNRVPVWFWAMIRNLDLAQFHDGVAYVDGDVIGRLLVWMDREYFPEGIGGPFPLHNPQKDQREVELWWQAQAWLSENYPE